MCRKPWPEHELNRRSQQLPTNNARGGLEVIPGGQSSCSASALGAPAITPEETITVMEMFSDDLVVVSRSVLETLLAEWKQLKGEKRNYGQPDLQRVALYPQCRLHHIDIIKPFSGICRRARFVCNVRVLGRVLALDHMRVINAGPLIQIHTFPSRFHEPVTYIEYFSGMPSFFEDSIAMLCEVHTPVVL